MTTTVKVSNISTKATEKDLWEFFAFSGEIQSIQTQMIEESFTQTAYVTFVEEKALETALLLTGAVIVDRPVSVEPAPGYRPPPSSESVASPPAQAAPSAAGTTSASGTSVDRAQEMMANLLAKGYILSKDAMGNAKAFDQKHELSKTATVKAAVLAESASTTAASLDRKIGLSQKLQAGATAVNESLKTVDEKYGVVDKSRAAFAVAEQKVNEAAAALMRNQYVASGANWFSGAFSKMTKAAEDMSAKTKEKVQQQEAERAVGNSGEARNPALSHPDFSLPPTPLAGAPPSGSATASFSPSEPAVLQADAKPAKVP